MTHKIKQKTELKKIALSVPIEIKKGFQSLETLVFASSGNWTRTSDLRVMSPTSYLLLYPAILIPKTTYLAFNFRFIMPTKLFRNANIQSFLLSTSIKS